MTVQPEKCFISHKSQSYQHFHISQLTVKSPQEAICSSKLLSVSHNAAQYGLVCWIRCRTFKLQVFIWWPLSHKYTMLSTFAHFTVTGKRTWESYMPYQVFLCFPQNSSVCFTFFIFSGQYGIYESSVSQSWARNDKFWIFAHLLLAVKPLEKPICFWKFSLVSHNAAQCGFVSSIKWTIWNLHLFSWWLLSQK